MHYLTFVYNNFQEYCWGNNVGNGFKDWATAREFQVKREEEWGLYITRMNCFPVALIRNHNDQNRFQVPHISEDLKILFVYCFW